MQIWLLGVVAALVLVPGTWLLVQRQARAKAEDRANQAVAAQVEAARAQVSRQRWDEATALLQSALATEKATNLEEARALWTHVRREQALRTFRAAEAALEKHHPAQALGLLRAYLENPFGAEHDRATRLKEQLERIPSDAVARALLHRQSDAALADFATTGTLAELDGMTHPDVRAIHLDRLRPCLSAELEQREQEQARRVQRVQATPVFAELQEFVVLTRRRFLAQAGGGHIDYRLLTSLLRELNVNDADEQQRVLVALSTRPLDTREAEKISRMRANLKERFRSYKDFDKSDWEIFDRVVDQELNSLAQELQTSPNRGPYSS